MMKENVKKIKSTMEQTSSLKLLITTCKIIIGCNEGFSANGNQLSHFRNHKFRS